MASSESGLSKLSGSEAASVVSRVGSCFLRDKLLSRDSGQPARLAFSLKVMICSRDALDAFTLQQQVLVAGARKVSICGTAHTCDGAHTCDTACPRYCTHLQAQLLEGGEGGLGVQGHLPGPHETLSQKT